MLTLAACTPKFYPPQVATPESYVYGAGFSSDTTGVGERWWELFGDTTLDELVEIAERYNNKVATLAVAMRSCTHPQNGVTITDLPQGIMEIGMGQHGEGGGGQKPLVSADDTAAEMVDLLCQQLKPKAGDKMMLIINGVGATTHMELNIIFRKAYKELEARGLQVVVSRIQEILTVQEQAGFQMIMAILDEDHIDYLKNKRADAPYWTTIGK